jgi:phosphohistidine swiveling domain-containing protein
MKAFVGEKIEPVDGLESSKVTETRLSTRDVKQAKIKTTKKEETENKVRLSPNIKLEDEYSTDLKELRSNVINQATKNRGFVRYTYRDTTLKIPKLPLLHWIDSMRCRYGNTESLVKQTWKALSECNLKTENDCIYHSDWWIGAGIPIYAYSLEDSLMNYVDFNKKITEFAYNIYDREFNCDEPIFLAGGDLSLVKGKVVKPTDGDSVTEGSIVILPSGGVEFDSYLRTACKNKRGAIILEVGNKVSHLAVVARESGYRVLLIPNAMNLFTSGETIIVDPENKKVHS